MDGADDSVRSCRLILAELTAAEVLASLGCSPGLAASALCSIMLCLMK